MRIIRMLITLCMMWQNVVGNDYYYTMDLPVYWGNATALSLTCNNCFSTNYTHSPSVASSRPLFMPTHADVETINLYGTQQLTIIQKQQTNLLNKVKYLSSQEVAHAISKAPVINVFKAHFLYSLPTYLAQIKELPGWTAYILALEQEIKQNRKKYWHTQGFKVHEKFWGKSTSEFNEKVHELAADARQMQSNETAHLQQVTKKLSKQVKNLTQNPATKNEWLAKRTVQKIHQDDFHQDQQAFHAGADIPYINEKLQHVETYRDAFEEHEHHELASYGFAMAQAADTEVMHGSYGGWERAHHRMDATLQTINNPDYTMESAHNLSKQQLDTYVAGGGNIMQLRSEHDTILQNCLHRELISTIDDTTQLELLYGEGLFAGNIYSLVYRCTDAALQYKQENRITMATNLSDFCHSLYQSCADYAVSLGTTGIGYTKDALELVMRVSSKSCGILGEHARTYLTEAVKHPIKTAADVTLLFTAPSFYLAKTIYSIYQNFDEIKQAADTYRSLCRTNPDDAAALALAYSLEMVLTGKALQAASVKFAPQLQAVETIFAQTQQEVAYAVAGAKVKVNIPTPLAALGNTTKDLLVKQAGNINRILQMQEGLPIDCVSRKVIEKYWIKGEIPQINWRHIFVGEKRKGFHYKPNYPEKIEKIIAGPNEFGVTRARIINKAGEGVSDLFPSDWSRLKVAEKIKEAYANIINVTERCVTGVTQEGMKIKIWFIEKDGILKINSAYPPID